jgi:hypothetical protein
MASAAHSIAVARGLRSPCWLCHVVCVAAASRCSCIAEAKEFLAAHGVHYAEGSTNIVPDPALNSSVSISASGVGAAPAVAVAAIAAALKPESGADGMEIDAAPNAVVKLESGAASSAAAAVTAATPTPALAAPLDSVAQLRSFLDSIPDE